MKKKTIITMALCFALMPAAVYAETAPKVVVNGQKLDADAVIINDRTYVPLRGVFEAAGAQVSWDGQTQTANVNTVEPSESEDEVIPNMIARVSPSVVGIVGKCKSDTPYLSGSEYISHGSGVIIKSGGEILTNAHVVEDMTMIMVVMNDGKAYEAKLKYIDKDTDLAVIKINKIGLPAVSLSDDQIVVGKTAVAIGAPITMSLRNSATVGHISGVDRSVGDSYRLIQTDAAINPGNSGGALVDLQGKVMGITSSGYLQSQNTGFAIPVSTVRYVLKQFETYGRVRHASLKAEYTEDWLAQRGLPSQSGLTIRGMEADSPLKSAGVEKGDVLVSVNGTEVNSIVEINEKLKDYLPDDCVKIGVKHDGNISYYDVKLAEKTQKED